MGRCKDIVIKPISAKDANRIIKTIHYSGKVVPNSKIHFGIFLDGKCGGALSYGSSLNKKGTMRLVEGTGWNDFIELNRMALAEWLPRNSESRCIAISLKLLKKNYPHLNWCISFADGTQCGDGAIYRATGFVLTDIRKNTNIKYNPKTGEQMHTIQAYHKKMSKEFVRDWVNMEGYQFRYVYFWEDKWRKRLTVDEIPYSRIDELGDGMYKGEARS